MIERQRNSPHLLRLLQLLGHAGRKHLEEQRVALALLALQLARLLRQIRGVHLQVHLISERSARWIRRMPTWMVATALRISMMMMGDTTNTRTTMAMPATSLLLASCNVELTYSLMETNVSHGRSIRLANSVQRNVRQCKIETRAPEACFVKTNETRCSDLKRVLMDRVWQLPNDSKPQLNHFTFPDLAMNF